MSQSNAKASSRKRAAKRAKAKGKKGTATRPRQHVLEKLSKRAFASALPASMVERDLPDDYGVDYEVELFDEDGSRTGATFKVQLKSTDSDVSKRSIKVSDFAYWGTLDVPVLLVLYKADTGALLSTWAHAHNPWPPPHGKKTTTVKFEVPFSTQLEQVPRDLERMREVRSSVLRGPVALGVSGFDSSAALRLRHALRATVSDIGAKRFLTIVNDDDAHALVTWHEDQLVVSGPAGMASLTIHNMEFEDIAEAAGDVVGLVSILLLQLGADQVAAEILVLARGALSSAVSEGMAMPMALVLAAAHKWAELADLVRAAPTLDSATDAFSVAVMARVVMGGPEAEMFIRIARESADELEADGRNDAAAWWLMLATFIAVEHERWPDAREMLARVPELTTTHDDDPLLYELVGKAHWNLGDHVAALANYRRAWKLGWRSEQAVAALGEALMMNGEYRKAFKHLSAARPELMTRWATLMLVSVEAIIDLTGVENQDRLLFGPGDEGAAETDDPDEVLALLRGRDALNAALLDKHSDLTESISVGVAVWIAVVAETPLYWANAVLVAGLADVEERTLRAIVEAAVLDHPDVLEVLASVQQELLDQLPDDFFDRAREMSKSAEPYEGPPVMPFRPVEMLAWS